MGKKELDKNTTKNQSNGRDEGEDKGRCEGTGGEVRGMRAGHRGETVDSADGTRNKDGDGAMYRRLIDYYMYSFVIPLQRLRRRGPATPSHKSVSNLKWK